MQYVTQTGRIGSSVSFKVEWFSDVCEHVFLPRPPRRRVPVGAGWVCRCGTHCSGTPLRGRLGGFSPSGPHASQSMLAVPPSTTSGNTLRPRGQGRHLEFSWKVQFGWERQPLVNSTAGKCTRRSKCPQAAGVPAPLEVFGHQSPPPPGDVAVGFPQPGGWISKSLITLVWWLPKVILLTYRPKCDI